MHWGLARHGRGETLMPGLGAATAVVGAWRRSWLAYAFDRNSGRYSRRLVRLGQRLPVCGFGEVETTREYGRMFFGLYRWGGRMWLQAGERCWSLDDGELRLLYRLHPEGRFFQFTVNRGEKLVFHCSCARGLFDRPQPAGDNVDLEARYFLAHVAGQALPLFDSDVWHDGETSDEAPTAQDVRHAVRDHLELLADLERQREQERHLPSGAVGGELLRAWFDDSYQPDSALFRKAFARPEREVLRRFTTVLQTAADEIGDALDIEDLQARPIWARVVLDATQALREVPATSLPRH
jgi:hypothetical protein